jgi:two-component system, LytTR family, response regulator
MITAIHIEDEPRNLALLENFVREYCSETIMLVGSARSLSDAIQLIKEKKPQLVYLDIELSQGNAFTLLSTIKEINFEIIFITAFSEHAVKAFRLNAIDYLLKPISIDELKEATARAVEKINRSTSPNANILKAIKGLSESSNNKIGIPVNDGVLFIQCDDIIKIEAKGSYSIIYLTALKKITCTKNLKHLQRLLPESFFLRVHHSWIVNLKYLKKYYRGKHGYMEMEDGSTVSVSVRKKGNFLNHFPE